MFEKDHISSRFEMRVRSLIQSKDVSPRAGRSRDSMKLSGNYEQKRG